MLKQDSTSCEKLWMQKSSMQMNYFMDSIMYVIEVIKLANGFCYR